MCVGCPKGWECCKKVLGVCVCKRPGWDNCCEKIIDSAFISENSACAALKKPLKLALIGARETVDETRHTLDVANAAVLVEKNNVNSADVAIAELEAVKVTYKVGVDALSAFANFALTEILNIHEMYFKVALSVTNGGQFQCRVKGILMGNNIDVNLDFDTNNIFGIAKSLGERAVSGIRNLLAEVNSHQHDNVVE